MTLKCIKCVTAYHYDCIFEIEEKDGSIFRKPRVSFTPIRNTRHIVCSKHSSSTENAAHQQNVDEATSKKLPPAFSGSNGDVLTFEERQDINRNQINQEESKISNS
jgi:hypothetical protein